MPIREQIRALSDYMLSLQKQIAYVLQNLDEENMSEKMTRELSDVKETSGKVGDKVDKDQIIPEINRAAGNRKIDADKLSLEGLSTANGAFKVNQAGNVEATGGTVGGFTLGAQGVHTGQNSADTAPTLYVGLADIMKAVAVAGSEARKDWRLLIGANFGVTADGTPFLSGGKTAGTVIDTTGIAGYGQLLQDVSDIKQAMLGTMTLNALTLSTLTFGTTALSLRQIAVGEETVTVLAAE